MAIKLTITNEKGMITKHHRIAAMSVTTETIEGVETEFIDINLYSYASKAVYDKSVTEKKDLHYASRAIRLPIGDGNVSKARIYDRIKAEIPEFSAAVSE